MKMVKRYFVAMLVAMLALASATYAQVLNQVPADALVVLRVNNLDATSKKVKDLATALGLVNYQPELSDPLTALLKPMGITAGVNRASDLAIYMVDPATVGGDPQKAVVGLFPVSDYQAFLGNFPDAKTEGALTTVQFKNSPDPSYLAHWGDYVAVSDSKDYLSKKPEAMLETAGLAAKELANKDIVIYANMKAIRPLVLPQIEKGRGYLNQMLDQAISSNEKVGTMEMSKVGPVAKVALGQVLTYAQQFIEDTDAATYGTNLSADGIATTFMVEFRPDSKTGQLVGKIKNTDESLLAGLPDGKYLMFGGGRSDGKLGGQWLSEFLAPIQKSITDLGPDYAPVNDYLASFLTMVSSQTGSAFGMMAPTGALGQGSLFQMVQIHTGDSKTLMDAMQKMYQSQDALMKTMGLDAAATGTQQTFVPAAKTLDGVTFDELRTSFNQNPKTPAEQQARTYLTIAYGPQGLEMYTGAVNDKTVLMSAGLSDALMSSAIAAAKNMDEPLAKSSAVKAVASQLPAQRIAAFYLPLDVWASTGLSYAKQFAMDMGVKLPDDLPPIGFTAGTDGSAIRYDAYVPTQLMQALTSAGLQLYMSFQRQMNPNGGAAPGGAAPGGAAPRGGL